MRFTGIWYKVSIRNKQLIFFGIIILCMGIISFSSYYTAYTFMDRFNRNLSNYFGIHRFLYQFAAHRNMLESVLEEDNSSLDAYYQHVSHLKVMLARIDRESNTSRDTYFLFNAINNALSVYLDECQNAIDAQQAQREDFYIPYYSALRIGHYIEDYITQLLYVSLSEGSWSYNRLVQRAHTMRTAGFIAIAAILAVSLAFAFLFSAYLSRPVRKLADAALRISRGDLDVQAVHVPSQDEVGVLASSFNVMSASIRQMVQDLKEKARIEKKLHEEEVIIMKMEQSLREAQFLGLQAQINPHFLFNTLNAISRTSMFEGAEKTTALIQSLSRLFRYNLRNPNKTISLAEELEIVREYLHIQQHRFGERIRFRIECSLDPEEIQVPPFILQPLVENAVVHGLEPKEEGGLLLISIRKRRKRLNIRIMDSGTGMTAEKLGSLLEGQDETLLPDSGRGIGVRNVLSRTRLHYNGKEKISFISRQGRGTLISLSLPLCRTEAHSVQTSDR